MSSVPITFLFWILLNEKNYGCIEKKRLIPYRLAILSLPINSSYDAIFYLEDGRLPIENQFWFTDIKIAFEHENHFSNKLYQELSHLLITKADLKVLVGNAGHSIPTSPEKLSTLQTNIIIWLSNY